MAVRLFSYDDPNAPALSVNNDGSLLNILRACLIDGYGTRTPAGWSMPHSDLVNQKAVFKPVTSSVYLQVDDNYHYQYAQIKGFMSMSDVNTGTGGFPRDTDLASGFTLRAAKRPSISAGYDRWWLVVDDEWVVFYSASDTNVYPGGFFFGKFNCVDVNFPNPFIITGFGSSATSLSTTYRPYTIFNATNGDWFVAEKYNQTSIPERIDVNTLDIEFTNPNPMTGKLEFQPEWIRSRLSPYCRYGAFFGRYRCLGNSATQYVTGDKININGVKYLVVCDTNVMYLHEYAQETG